MGTPKSPFERYRSRAASLTSWSNAGWMKSANWISATGSRPCRAMPIATPTMPDSASGVSRTRSSPNSSRNPAVTRNTPPRAPTSSPRTSTRSSSCISSHRVSWMVWTTFFSVISVQVLQRRVGFGVRRVPRLLDGPVHGRLQVGPLLLDALVVEQPLLLQLVAEPHDGIVALRLLDLLPGAVGAVVVVG